jgi:hypothetical protein
VVGIAPPGRSGKECRAKHDALERLVNDPSSE